MRPLGHLAVSAGTGAVLWALTDEPWAFVSTVTAGVLVDADHVVDYANWALRQHPERVLYVFHGWEYLAPGVALGALLSWPPALVGALLGYALHLIGDQFANRAYPLSYSIVYRARHHFRMLEVSPWTPDASLHDLRSSLPFAHRWVPALLRRLTGAD